MTMFGQRRRRRFHWPITLSASLISLNVTLMVCWIVLFAQRDQTTAVTIGVVAFALILIGLSFWLVLTIKEIRLNQRQANFVDSVTHELKSPISALQLYLETLRMRSLDERQRAEFHEIMGNELHRLDRLINQLLEVGRLDAIGETEAPSEINVADIIRESASAACYRYHCDQQATLDLHLNDVVIPARQIMLEMIYSNLIDNAVKYAGSPPQVRIELFLSGSNVRTRIWNNGSGVPQSERKKIFNMFHRGGSELERRQKGTGLGLYIVHVLVRKMKGRISVHDRPDGHSGCVFELELPGRRVRFADVPAAGQERASPAPPPAQESEPVKHA